jgi:hypothetical protein
MIEFPEAIVKKAYKIEGYEGDFRLSSYREAKDNPAAIRAVKNNKVCWFLPLVTEEEGIVDLASGIEDQVIQ